MTVAVAMENFLEDQEFWAELGEIVKKTMEPVFRKLLEAGYEAAEEQLLAQGHKQLTAEATDLLMQAQSTAFATQWWNQLDGVTRDKLRSAIRSSAEAGMDFPKLVKDIDPLFGEQRAMRIATTETTRLFAQGAILNYQQAGVPMVQWRTAMDFAVCSHCRSREGQSWKTGEQEMPPAHVGCRCFIMPQLEKAGEIAQPPMEFATHPMPRDYEAMDHFIKNPEVGFLQSSQLSTAEVEALKSYQSVSFFDMNNLLRTGTAPASRREELSIIQKRIDSAIAKSTLKDPLVVWRGGDLPGLVNRPVVGMEFTDNAFVSTSIDRWQAAQYAEKDPSCVLMRIVAPKGSKAISSGVWTEHTGEYEVLFGRGLRFRVTADEVVDKVRQLTLEVI